MPELVTILVGEDPPHSPPNSTLDAIWPRAAAVLRHYALLNRDETRVRELQHGVLKHGILIVPSIYRDGGDFCRSSFFHQDLIFYRFSEGPEEYFWISSQLDRCYSLSVLYLSHYRTALALYPYTAETHVLESFERTRSLMQRPFFPLSAAPPKPVTVTGYHHMIHHLWNQLPALDRAIKNGLGPNMSVVATFQPLGPLDEIFPELQGRIEIRAADELNSLHSRTELFVALGAWSIPETTQQRVIRVAREHVDEITQKEQAEFRERYWPIFWISVKPEPRTCANQVAVLASLIVGLNDRHPDAGFILDGVSYPWDYTKNQSYQNWFRALMEAASETTATIIRQILTELPKGLQTKVRCVTDVSVSEEIGWAEVTDFYICHGGSMQNKLGWLHPIPGVAHSNRAFMASARGQIPPVERAVAACIFVADDMIIDDDAAGYTPMQLARKDQSYRFVSVAKFLEFVLDAFDRQSLQPFERPRLLANGHPKSARSDVCPDMIASPKEISLKVRDIYRSKDQNSMYEIEVSDQRALLHTGAYYIDFLRLIDQHLQPEGYFEIGTDTGASLNSFSCDAVCVDPNFQVAARVWRSRRRTLLYQCTSDEFFAREKLNSLLPGGPDVVFLDGMHRAEYLLRDFINTERMAHRRTLVLLHDCLPLNVRMAERVARRGDESEGIYRDAWTGDVWRVLFALKKFRPDLKIRYLDCPPTGLIAVSDLRPESTVLFENYEACADLMAGLELSNAQLRVLWGMYPTLDTAALAANPADISAMLNCH